MRSLFLYLLVTLTIIPVFAEEPDIFGYFETQLMGTRVGSQYYQLYTNKLRVDLDVNLSERISFAANFDYITYHGKTEWELPVFLPAAVTKNIPVDMEGLYVLPFSDRQFLDNAYLKISFKYMDLIVGKQQLSLGTGYVWNPLDIFNIKDPLDPTYEQPGHNALRVDLPLGLSSSISAIYSPAENMKNSAKLLRIKSTVSRFDLSLVAAETQWTFHNYEQFDNDAMNFIGTPETRRLIGGSTAGELLGLGVWAEYAFNKMETSDDFHSLVVGSDYTFDFQTYFMVEYYRNTLGKSDYRNYTLTDWMQLLANEKKAISRDQLYLYVQHPVTDFLEFGVSNIFSISDRSWALVPTINYSFSQNVEITVYLNFNVGKDATAFATETGHSGLLRARVYF